MNFTWFDKVKHDLLIAYQHLSNISFDIKEEWNYEHFTTDKELETSQKVESLRDDIILSALHTMLTEDPFYPKEFKSLVDGFTKMNADNLDIKKFDEAIAFYLNSYKNG